VPAAATGKKYIAMNELGQYCLRACGPSSQSMGVMAEFLLLLQNNTFKLKICQKYHGDSKFCKERERERLVGDTG
jgi:hypothetical protein